MCVCELVVVVSTKADFSPSEKRQALAFPEVRRNVFARFEICKFLGDKARWSEEFLPPIRYTVERCTQRFDTLPVTLLYILHCIVTLLCTRGVQKCKIIQFWTAQCILWLNYVLWIQKYKSLHTTQTLRRLYLAQIRKSILPNRTLNTRQIIWNIFH